MYALLRFLGALGACLPLTACMAEPVETPLPALGVEPDTVTVSGISSGGYMAVQYQVAHSASVAGAAVLAAGPWYCARGEVMTALGACVHGPHSEIDVGALTAAARAAAADSAIDALEGLSGDRAWIFHGARDTAVSVEVTRALADFLREFLPPERVTVVESVPAAHTFPTLATGGDCGEPSAPFLGACDYDAAGELLAALYGDLAAPQTPAQGELEAFDQRPFRELTDAAALGDVGFVYVPPSCRNERAGCRLHVAFHGCKQGNEFVEDAFARDAGYNRWARTNRIVVLYPQVRSTLSPLNPMGCWDWWGYEGPDYATRSGAQLHAVRAMVERLGRAAE